MTPLLFYTHPTPPRPRVPSYPWHHKDGEQERAAGPFHRGISGEDLSQGSRTKQAAPQPLETSLAFVPWPSRVGGRDPNEHVCAVLLNRVLCNTEGSDYTGDPS